MACFRYTSEHPRRKRALKAHRAEPGAVLDYVADSRAEVRTNRKKSKKVKPDKKQREHCFEVGLQISFCSGAFLFIVIVFSYFGVARLFAVDSFVSINRAFNRVRLCGGGRRLFCRCLVGLR